MMLKVGEIHGGGGEKGHLGGNNGVKRDMHREPHSS